MTLPSGDVPEAVTSASGRGFVPFWLLAVLMGAAGSGVLMSLVSFWWCFVGSGPYMDPSFPGPSDVRFADRAGWWLDLGVSFDAFATLVAVGAFGWASAQPGHREAARGRLRKLGAVLSAVMAALMFWGLVAVVVGQVGVLRDPTAARGAWITTNQFHVPALVSSLMLALLFAGLTWWLWPDRAVEILAPQLEPAQLDIFKPGVLADAARPDASISQLGAQVHSQDDDAQARFRRPRGHSEE